MCSPAMATRKFRPPIVERTELFRRSVGEGTDIVEKEMYTFADRKGESLTLRPECTASCVRAGGRARLAEPRRPTGVAHGTHVFATNDHRRDVIASSTN